MEEQFGVSCRTLLCPRWVLFLFVKEFQGRARQGVNDEAKLAEWAYWMEQNFPNMQNGDDAVMVALEGGGMALYHNQIKLGETDDPAFVKAFFSIWLADNALKPKLSRQLRGLGAG